MNPIIRGSFELQPHELFVDNFAGGGGASSGVRRAIDRPVDFAVNHSPVAIAMHKANHPETRHFCEDVFEVDPAAVAAGRRIGGIWFSPDCTQFSKAKGSKPRDKKIRGLAWVVLKWAALPPDIRPRVIFLENVEEFADWGPLDDNDMPIKERAGETFREWKAKLADLGYVIEHRILVAADYGAPTIRKRLFLVARSDGHPIVWPEPTHGKGRQWSWRAASEIIDWSVPVPSIFDRKKPLVENTLRRIVAGIRKYVLEATKPFVMPLTHHGAPRIYDLGDPMRTVTGAHRGEFALVEPFIVRHGHNSNKTGVGMVEGTGWGTFRGQRLENPLSTVCATNDRHLVCPVITKEYGGGRDRLATSATYPLGTITVKDHHRLCAALLERCNVGSGRDRSDEVRAFLMKYYGSSGKPQNQGVGDPLHTVTAKARFGLVTVRGVDYRIVDIGMRMLKPRELFNAQGFDQSYIIDPELHGRALTVTEQTELAGNSVPPDVADAIVSANLNPKRDRVAA